MPESVRSIRDPAELAGISAWHLIPNTRAAPIRLESAGSASERMRAWETRLNQLQRSCGCDQGAIGLLVGAAGYCAYLFLRAGGWGHPGWPEFWVGFGVLTVTTSLGKFLGLAAAQRELRRLVTEIRSEWRRQDFPDSDGRHVTRVRAGTPRARHCCG